MKTLKIVTTIVFAIASGVIAYLLIDNVKTDLDKKKAITEQEELIKAKLADIRDIEILYNSVYGNYVGSWDSLIYFVKDSSVVVTDKREEITQNSYTVNGQKYTADSVTIIVDTVAQISVKDSVFESNYPIDSLPYVPNTRFKFNITAESRSGINYLEVFDPKPLNPERRKGKLSPLKIGSLAESTLKGNWEKK